MRFASLCTVMITALLGAWSAHAADPAFTLVVQTDVAGFSSPSDHQFTLPLYPGYAYDATVAWGDGTTSELTSDVGPTHTYASAGTYTVKVTEHVPGGFPAIRFDNTADCLKVRELSNWGDVTWATFNKAFPYCSNLVITATDGATARTGGVTDFTSAWYGCRSLTSFPLIDTGSATTLASAWGGCSGLTSFPLLDTSAATDLSGAWERCSGLTAFPVLDTHAATSLYATWYGCSGLTHFPLLDTSAVTDFSQAWNVCTGLVDFPLIDTSHGTDFTATWAYCFSLASFPALDTPRATELGSAWYLDRSLASFPALDTAHVTSCYQTWSGCTQLTAFPALDLHRCAEFTRSWESCSGLTSFPVIDTGHGTVFNGTWSGCSGITDFPLLPLTRMTSGDACFAGVTLPVETYDRLLIALAGATASSVVFDAGSASRYYAATAHDTLTGGRGWTISDDGALPLITSAHHATVFTDTAFSYQVGLAPAAVSATVSALPAWLAYDAGTRTVSGTAPHATGSTSFVITVTAGDGAVERVTVALDIVPGSAFTLLIDTTLTEPGSSNDHQFILPLVSGWSYDCTVAWGDGTVQAITSGDSPTHTYTSPGIHAVAISENRPGGFPTIFFNHGGDRGKVLELRNWGTNRWLALNRSFWGCHRMVITAEDGATAATGTVIDFSGAWSDCTALTSFPLIDTHSGQSFSNTWSDCSALTSFPLIDTGAATDLTRAWSNCQSLTAFPLLDTSAVTSFWYTWIGCQGLTSFPALDTHSGLTFANAWDFCTGLTGFPLLDTSAGTDFSDAWSGCSALASFPALDLHLGTSFARTWFGCSSLTSFPAIDLSSAETLDSAWLGCAGLTEFPLLDISSATDLTYAWAYCTGLTTFPLLDTHAVTGFYAAWYSCSGLTHFPLLDTSAGTVFSHAWAACSALSGFPALDTSHGVDFSDAWADCTDLVSFPALNTSAGTDFSGAWANCHAITGFPVLDLHRMTAGASCFYGVTLETATYDRMLTILAAGATATGVLFDAGANNTYTASAAHDHLTDDLGWTIVDASLPPTLRSPLVYLASIDSAFSYTIDFVAGTGCDVSDLPAWLTYNPGTFTIAGRTPESVGSDSFTITVHGLHGENVPFTVTIYYNQTDGAPFVSQIDATYTVGGATPPNYQITASNSPTSYGASGLPSGLTLDPHSGLITGNATGAHPGSYRVLITASNSNGTGAAFIHLTLAGDIPPLPDEDTGATNPAHCGLGGGVALITLFGLTAFCRGTRKRPALSTRGPAHGPASR